MAIIGVKHLVYAPVTAFNAGARPTYGAGAVLAKLTKADYSPNSVDGKFYADDMLQEEDHYVGDGTITVGIDDLTQDTEKGIFGNKTNGTAVKELYKSADDTAPYLGLGYIVPKKRNGVKVYEGRWLLKVMFKEPADSAETKGESINFQGKELEGTFSPVDGFEGGRYMEKAEFATESAAIEWLHSKANISGVAAASAPATTQSNK